MRSDHNFLQEHGRRLAGSHDWPDPFEMPSVQKCFAFCFFEKFVAKKTPVSKDIMKVYFCEFYESMLIKECYLCSICFHLVTQRKKQDVKRDIKEECKSCLPLEKVGFEAIFFPRTLKPVWQRRQERPSLCRRCSLTGSYLINVWTYRWIIKGPAFRFCF